MKNNHQYKLSVDISTWTHGLHVRTGKAGFGDIKFTKGSEDGN